MGALWSMSEASAVEAAMANDADRIDNCLYYGVSPNAADPVSGRPLLYYAVSHGNERMARALLDAGASPNFDVTATSGLLAFAINEKKSRDTLIPEALINCGADCRRHEAEAGACSPLQAAVESDDFQRVMLLLAHGADARQRAATGKPLVYAAASKCNDRVTLALVDAGANVNAVLRTSHGECSLLHHAIRSSYPRVAHSLIRAGADVGSKNEVGCSVLSVLAQYAAHLRDGEMRTQWLAMLRTALAAATQEDIEAVDDIGMTLADYATADGSDPSRSPVMQLVNARELQLADPRAAAAASESGDLDGAAARLPRPAGVQSRPPPSMLQPLRDGETRFPGEEGFAAATEPYQLLSAISTMKGASQLHSMSGSSLPATRQRLVALFKAKRVASPDLWSSEVAAGVGSVLRALVHAHSAAPGSPGAGSRASGGAGGGAAQTAP